MATVISAGSLRDYRALEARHAPWRPALIAALAGVAIIAGTYALLPRLPHQVIDFMCRGFLLRDMGGVLLFNDYTGVYFMTFFAGLVGLLGVVVTPREERKIELLLSKPVRASDLLAARTWPVLGMTALVGLTMAGACAASVVPYAGPGASVSVAGAFGASLMLTAVVLVEIALLSVLFVRISDGMNALLIGLTVALIPLIPSAVFLYRPDLFEGHPRVTSLTVIANLVWYDSTLSWLGPTALAVALAFAALLVRAGGALLERADRV